MRIPMHRFNYTKLTKDQIGTKLRAVEAGPKSASAFSNVLNGKTLKIVTRNGPTLEYKFAANKRLTLTEGGKQVSAGYGELALNQMVFFSHLIPGGDGVRSVAVQRYQGECRPSHRVHAR